MTKQIDQVIGQSLAINCIYFANSRIKEKNESSNRILTLPPRNRTAFAVKCYKILCISTKFMNGTKQSKLCDQKMEYDYRVCRIKGCLPVHSLHIKSVFALVSYGSTWTYICSFFAISVHYPKYASIEALSVSFCSFQFVINWITQVKTIELIWKWLGIKGLKNWIRISLTK